MELVILAAEVNFIQEINQEAKPTHILAMVSVQRSHRPLPHHRRCGVMHYPQGEHQEPHLDKEGLSPLQNTLGLKEEDPGEDQPEAVLDDLHTLQAARYVVRNRTIQQNCRNMRNTNGKIIRVHPVQGTCGLCPDSRKYTLHHLQSTCPFKPHGCLHGQ